jgi:gas vesicle protein GvpL/GvpF
MKCLAYCILPEQHVRPELPGGPGGQPLQLVSEAGLAIVFARVPSAPPTPTVASLLHYARVIELLHQQCPVLPMRYGCLLDGEDQLRNLLRRRHAIFQACLQELKGSAEMSLRILSASPGGELEPRLVPGPLPGGGAAYLAARRAHYLAQDRQRWQESCRGDGLRHALRGLYRDSRTERSDLKGCSLISVHFLVPLEGTESFRAAFRQFQQHSPLKLLLSGPWPPYNFADCAELRSGN